LSQRKHRAPQGKKREPLLFPQKEVICWMLTFPQCVWDATINKNRRHRE
jgi:hypothetical protein